jgi:hypothetical protein
MRLRWVALMLTSGVGAALPIVLSLGSETAAAVAGLAAMSMAVLRGRKFVAAQAGGGWCVRPDGTVSVRWDAGGEVSDGVTAAFVASFLILLRDGRRTLEVWRDATPTTAFRRLAVSIRWNVAREPYVVLG